MEKKKFSEYNQKYLPNTWKYRQYLNGPYFYLYKVIKFRNLDIDYYYNYNIYQSDHSNKDTKPKNKVLH